MCIRDRLSGQAVQFCGIECADQGSVATTGHSDSCCCAIACLRRPGDVYKRQDLARSEAARELYEYCEREKLQIGILVNNAGIFFFDDLTEVAPERIETMLLLHIRTVTLLCRYFGAAMKRRRAGYILNMSSLSAWTPAPGISVYAASKSYIRKFSQMLRYELHQYGVGVTTVCPGAIATGLYNLSDYYQRLALRLGVMMKPERLARKGLRAMFARRDYILPGAVNRFFVLALYLLPVQLIYYIKEHTKLYRYGR